MASAGPRCEGVYHHSDGSKHPYNIPVTLTDDGAVVPDWAHALLPECWQPEQKNLAFLVYRDDRDCSAVTNTSIVSKSSSDRLVNLE